MRRPLEVGDRVIIGPIVFTKATDRFPRKRRMTDGKEGSGVVVEPASTPDLGTIVKLLGDGDGRVVCVDTDRLRREPKRSRYVPPAPGETTEETARRLTHMTVAEVFDTKKGSR